MNKTACLDPTYAFQDFRTFSGCFYSWGNATNNAPSVFLPSNSTFGGVIRGCPENYCDAASSALGECRYKPYDTHYSLTSQPVVDFTPLHAIKVEHYVTTDIAGPGVLISYILQIVVILYIWLAVFLTGLPNKKPKSRSNLMRQIAEHRSVLQYILVEFQEAQCFMIAIQLASILAIARSADLYDATNLRQLAENVPVSECVSIGAMVSITLGLWLVHKTNMKSWYTLLCSTITMFLSIVTYFMSIHWPAMPDGLSLPEGNGGLHECGHHHPP